MLRCFCRRAEFASETDQVVVDTRSWWTSAFCGISPRCRRRRIMPVKWRGRRWV